VSIRLKQGRVDSWVHKERSALAKISRILVNVTSQSGVEIVFRIRTTSSLPAIMAGLNTSSMKLLRFSRPPLLFVDGKSLAKSSNRASMAKKSKTL
jgi:hypothetical protein